MTKSYKLGYFDAFTRILFLAYKEVEHLAMGDNLGVAFQ